MIILGVILFSFNGLPSLSSEKTNIIVILADDMGFDSVSSNNSKIGNMKTPCIDRLMEQGMRFSDAHSGSAVCTPTRYGLLTGRYCWRSRLKRAVLWEWAAPLIEKGRFTIAELLRREGYATGMIGKWHLGMGWHGRDGKIVNDTLGLEDAWFMGEASLKRIRKVERSIDFSRPVTGGPVDNGFDFYFGVDVPNFPPYAWIVNNRVQGKKLVPKPETMFGAPGPMVPGWKLENILPRLSVEADRWITRQGKTGKPFFLYFSLTSPHAPIAPSKRFKGRSGISDYADFVMETDAVVGDIMEVLDREGLADKTLLIFTTDNGTSPEADFRNLEKHGVDLHNHFSGHKMSIQEGGHRVPFVVRWPGKVKAGAQCEETVCLTDLMATFADILSCGLPENAGEDSFSILPLFLGKGKDSPIRPPVVHHDTDGNFAIRKGGWKFYERGQLYNLREDVKERKNVARNHPGIVKELSDVLKSYRQEDRSIPLKR